MPRKQSPRGNGGGRNGGEGQIFLTGVTELAHRRRQVPPDYVRYRVLCDFQASTGAVAQMAGRQGARCVCGQCPVRMAMHRSPCRRRRRSCPLRRWKRGASAHPSTLMKRRGVKQSRQQSFALTAPLSVSEPTACSVIGQRSVCRGAKATRRASPWWHRCCAYAQMVAPEHPFTAPVLFVACAQASLAPTSAILGGIIGQAVVKCISAKG